MNQSRPNEHHLSKRAANPKISLTPQNWRRGAHLHPYRIWNLGGAGRGRDNAFGKMRRRNEMSKKFVTYCIYLTPLAEIVKLHAAMFSLPGSFPFVSSPFFISYERYFACAALASASDIRPR